MKAGLSFATILATAAASATVAAWPSQATLVDVQRTRPNLRQSVAVAAVTAVAPASAPPVLVQPKADPPATGATPEGSFAIAGNANGTNYTGTAAISKIGGSMYRGKWTIGANTLLGVCVFDDPQLSCGWTINPKDANVMAYRIASDGLDGVWFEEGDTNLGKEDPRPASGKMPADLNGSYAIASADGIMPSGAHYSGTLDVTTASKNVLKLTWHFGVQTESGLAVRSDAMPDVLSADFSNGGDEFGTQFYILAPGGKTLSGVRAQSIKGTVTSGVETLTRP